MRYVFCVKQKWAYEMRIRDWSSDGCSSDLHIQLHAPARLFRNLHIAVDNLQWVFRKTLAILPYPVRIDGRYPTWCGRAHVREHRSEEHTSELQSLMRISYAVFCLKKKIKIISSFSIFYHL